MSDSVQEAFDLVLPPFDKELESELMWLEGGRQSGIDRLVETVVHHQHALVTGESGAGKTCVMRALRDALSPNDFRLVYLAHVTLGSRDFFRQLCYALNIEPKATPAAMFEGIQRECIAHSADQRMHSVVVFDELHLMPESTLRHLHLLTNFEWDQKPLLSMVFVGLPELHNRLKLGIHRSLLTRIHTHVELSPTSPELTCAYVRKRLADAGAKNEIFTNDGLAQLHEFCGGLLRSIDVLALAAMRLAAREDTALIDRDIVRRALAHTPLR